MTKSKISVAAIALLVVVSCFFGVKKLVSEPVAPYRVKTVVLDAGHGGHDSGCHGQHSHEKHVALDLVLKLGKLIENTMPDVKVIYTRKTDVFIPLHERAKIANRNQADLFISIHCNSAESSSAYGTETFTMGTHKDEANLLVAKRENSVITKEANYEDHYSYDPKSPVGHIVFSIYQDAYSKQSVALANRVEEEFKKAGRKSRGVKQAGFLVLYKTYMPSVLIESGFLSNKNEENFLANESGKKQMAKSIFNAFSDWRVEMEGFTLPDTKQPAIVKETKATKTKERKLEVAKVDVPTTKTSISDKKDKPNVSYTANKKESLPIENKAEKTVVVTKAENAESAKQENSSTDLKAVVIKKGIEFRIQFLATPNILDLKKEPYYSLPQVFSEKTETGILRYFSGRYQTPVDAKEALEKVRMAGFPDAFTAAYKDGVRIAYSQALTYFAQR